MTDSIHSWGDRRLVITFAQTLESTLTRTEWPHPFVAVDYDSRGQMIQAEGIGIGSEILANAYSEYGHQGDFEEYLQAEMQGR